MRKAYFLLGLVAFICGASAAEIECIKCESTLNNRTCIDQPLLITSTCNGSECYTKNENGFVQRGCSGRNIDCESGECYFCSKENKCNQIPATRNSSINCYRCNNCPGQPGDNLIEPCLEQVPYGLKEQCFTRISNSAGSVSVQRGCFYDLEEQEQEDCEKSANCKTCDSGENCNNHVGLTLVDEAFQCNICRSNITGQEGCALELKDDLEYKFNRTCVIPPKDGEKACFVDRLPNNVVVRDCITAPHALARNISKESCDDDVEDVKCNFCTTENCNTMKPRSSGDSLRVLGGLVAFAAFFVIKYL